MIAVSCVLFVLVTVAGLGWLDCWLMKNGLERTFEELNSEPRRWVDLAIKHGYQMHFCPTGGEPIIAGAFDEDTVRICGRCDCVYRVELLPDAKYKLNFIGHSVDITGMYIKSEMGNERSVDCRKIDPIVRGAR